MSNWQKVRIGDFLSESKVVSEFPNINRRITVRLNCNGVEKRKATESKEGATKYYIRSAKQFIYGKQNIHKGAFGIIPKSLDNYETSADLPCFDVDEDICLPEWIDLSLKANDFYKSFEQFARGIGSKRVSVDDFLNIEILLPSIEKQKEILKKQQGVKVFIKDLEAETSTQQSLLKQLKQTILQEAIEGKLTAKWREQNPDIGTAKELLEQIKIEKEKLIKEKKIKQGKKQTANEIEDLNIEIPDSWLLVDLDDITQYITDGTHQTPRYVENGRMFLSAQNVKPFKFMPEIYRCVSEEDYQKYIANRQTEKGDLLLGRVGAGIGETAVVDQDLEFAIYVSLGLVKTFKQFTNPEYLATVFNSPYGVRYAKGNISSGGGSAGNFNLGRIRSFPIPFPPLEEQKEIVATIEKLFEICDELESEINQNKTTVENLMATVLKEAFEQQ